ncbi:CDP-diacylglycerol--serine O-phosphatidyltransferase [Natroniella acetigena]|uniref:CDP-diacylglycerol--serine O-phosphatidyltransferase n=1 Tax=Natroniella acetigena TaxID=52004 RepID=UPI002009F24B|nr:CDP-diacylglycerol--serine O-phosphatidyltransferase [Natroniella acetigena]MCK8826461.1 CDP-diacylglycerol--serine O-phosphatidyltransferase [Natroniella acetigena]
MFKIERRFLFPNLITSLNLFFGFLSILMSLEGNFLVAAWLVLFAIVFDGLDGKVARKLEGYSQFGKEFDSFCDAVSFGIAPSILIYATLTTESYFKSVIIPVAFLFMLAGIVRLVRFNIETELSATKGDFIGMPIPAAAGLLASYYIFTNAVWGQFLGLGLFLGMAVLVSILMVSNLPHQNISNLLAAINYKYLIIILVVLLLAAEYLVFPLFIVYILINRLQDLKSNVEEYVSFINQGK